MSLFDKQNMLSDAQAITTGAAYSTNSIDLGAAQSHSYYGSIPSALNDFGRGTEKKLEIQVVETFTSAGAGTLTVSLVTGTGVDANGQINAGEKILESTPAIALATLVAGYKFRIRSVPHGIDQRYLALKYTVATADFTAGKVTAGIVHDKQQALP
jgi:hypothetical protein